MKEGINVRILGTVPREKAFYFFTSIGNYTGQSAASLKEFMDKIGVVNVKSLEFHLSRGDFEKWIAEVLEDKTLATGVGNLRRLNVSGDLLKNQLLNVVSRRYKELISSF